jgi:hypothetical protein
MQQLPLVVSVLIVFALPWVDTGGLDGGMIMEMDVRGKFEMSII